MDLSPVNRGHETGSATFDVVVLQVKDDVEN
jgi:hypothetical protein